MNPAHLHPQLARGGILSLRILLLTAWLFACLIPPGLAGDPHAEVAPANVGSAENWHNRGVQAWHGGAPGWAITAWERALWLDPGLVASRRDLEFAKRTRRLAVREISWWERYSASMPAPAWSWIASVGLWTALAFTVVPGRLWKRTVEKVRRTSGSARGTWHQGVAAAACSVCLLTLPALVGLHQRSHWAVLISPETLVRLTPTREGQVVAHLVEGESVRLLRLRGAHRRIRTVEGAEGWIEERQVARIDGLQEPWPDFTEPGDAITSVPGAGNTNAAAATSTRGDGVAAAVVLAVATGESAAGPTRGAAPGLSRFPQPSSALPSDRLMIRTSTNAPADESEVPEELSDQSGLAAP